MAKAPLSPSAPRVRPGSRYITDPPSAASTGLPTLDGTVFDVPRLMSFIRAGMIDGIRPLRDPSDEKLIATVVAHGMPRWAAEQMRPNPMLRLQFVMFWADVQQAAKGNPEAKERVDACMAAWQEMRKIELVSDDPHGSVGFWER